MAKKKKPKIRTSLLAKKILSNNDLHEEEFHGKKSAWDSFQLRDEKRCDEFIKRYFASLNNKWIYDRVDYIEAALKRSRYRPLEEITEQTIEMAMSPENSKKLRPGQKFYVKFQKSMILAVQVGQFPIEAGMNIAGAHIDSPCLVGRINKVKQNYNLAYMRADMQGHVLAKDFFNIPLSLFCRAIFKDNRIEQDVVTEFSIGEKNNEPCFPICETAYHFEDEKNPTPSINELDVIVGSEPYPDKRFDPKKRIMLNVLHEIHRRYKLTENNLKLADIWIHPSQKPRWAGIDKSMILSPGQDNWGSAFPLLYGFTQAKKPSYTKVAVFYDNEEIGDSGKAGLITNLIGELFVPALADLVKKSSAEQWQMLRNTWSLYLDVAEPIHGYRPKTQDPRDSAYLGSGIVMCPFSGDVGNDGGYTASVEMKQAMKKLMTEKKVVVYPAIMGTPALRIPQNSTSFHLSLSEGIDMGIPCIGMHRSNELAAVVDLWNMAKGIIAFYSVEDHEEYLPHRKR